VPTSIPYDPSLVLGNLVDPSTMDRLNQIAVLQAPIDAAQDTLNSFITMKRSMDMTVEELKNMGIDTTAVEAKSADVGKQITQAAVDYAATRLAQEQKIQPLRAKAVAVHEAIESPIDYNRTMLKQIPLSNDSLKMDAQFFSFEDNEQDNKDVVSSIKGYVTGACSLLGASKSFDIGAAAARQVNQQLQEHDISGTLVLTATCTHKMATVLAPFFIDVDKGIRVWNQMFTAPQDKLRTDATSLAAIAEQQYTAGEKSLTIISGCTYGSSFVGMVHILKQDDSTTNQDVESDEVSIQAQAKLGDEISGIAGGFGIDDQSAEDLKDLLSHASVRAHVTILTEGLIPSIKSNEVAYAVRQFANFDPKAMMDSLAVLAASTAGEHTTAETSSEAARTGQSLVALKGATVKNALSQINTMDAQKNKVIDVNSMMTAFDQYVKDATDGKIGGVPINFWLKPITKSQLAFMWVNKYYPGKFKGYSGDDSAQPPKSGAAAPAPAAQSTDSSGGGSDPNGAGSDPNAGGGDRGDGSGGGGGGDANGGDGSQQSS
jgi:hypothetical protein